jgi:hypothetical protein
MNYCIDEGGGLVPLSTELSLERAKESERVLELLGQRTSVA